jgi:DNA-binding response OmpR family regulator
MVGEMSPRLLICDLRLPGANGFQVVRSLCEMSRFKKMTIVVVSGLPLAEINAHGGLPESVEILTKPIDFERLQAIAHDVWSMPSAQKSITP